MLSAESLVPLAFLFEQSLISVLHNVWGESYNAWPLPCATTQDLEVANPTTKGGAHLNTHK